MSGEQFLGLFAETFIHPGAGSAGGAVDLPVAREAATGYPFIPGSGLKGALRDRARQHWPDERDGEAISLHPEVKRRFGQQEDAGRLLVSDARLLLLPVRSLTGAYVWVTCPLLLERLSRDRVRSGKPRLPDLSHSPAAGTAIANAPARAQKLYLEERTFSVDGEISEALCEPMAELIAHEATRNRLGSQLAILSDQDFSWFARYGLSVQARNQLTDAKTTGSWTDPESGEVQRGNLWYEETLPPDTLLYATLGDRHGDGLAADTTGELFGEHPYIQVGANETVGQGWLAVKIVHEEAP